MDQRESAVHNYTVSSCEYSQPLSSRRESEGAARSEEEWRDPDTADGAHAEIRRSHENP